MAYLKFTDSGSIVYLREHHTIGRRYHDVDTSLDYAFVSKLHTVIEWKDPNWLIRDMSSNGTWVNGDRLASYTPHVLRQGDTIQIAGSDGVAMQVTDLTEPADMIYQSEDHLETRALTENILLPDEISPLIEVYKCPERHQWFAQHINSQAEHGMELGPYEHGSQLQCGDTGWTFYVTAEDTATVAIESGLKNISDVEFRFDLSQNEENTNLTLIDGGQEIDLHERSHHYMLVHLLRHKHEQQASGKPINAEQEAGWMNCQLLTHDLGIDETHMNILVFRARKQITQALSGYSGSSHLFERRRGAIRVGIDKFSIFKEGVREL